MMRKVAEDMERTEEKKAAPDIGQMEDMARDRDVDALVALLDGCTRAEESRIQVKVVEGGGEVLSRQYHHGRCDIGSPWACGTAFDVLE